MGYAHSNVFDGDISFPQDDGAGELRLRGIHHRSEIGFLTLFEHYNCVQVGSNYKEPIWPVWVVCSESHYSVAFSTTAPRPKRGGKDPQVLDLKECRALDVCYFDPLAHDGEARITLSLGGRYDEESSLENVLRTKWPAAHIDWHGRERIL
jgi:hypothetical protein